MDTADTHDGVYKDCRFFVTYSGVELPLKLVNPIDPDSLTNRNTYIRAYYNEAGQLMAFDKIVYGEVELAHQYEYYHSGVLKSAAITMLEEDMVVLRFNEAGAPIC